MIKSNEQIEKLKASSKLADDCFEYICGKIKVGMTEIEVANLMKEYFLSHGASGLSFDTIVGSGVNSASIHSMPSDRKIEYGDVVQLDFGCILDDYCSDCSRVLFIGEVKPEYKEIYDIVYDAQKLGVEKTISGMTAKEADAICRDYIVQKGYNFAHAVGHAVGTEVHEQPVISPKNDKDILQDNEVFTIEPGIYLEGKFGIRIEDTGMLENGKFVPFNNTSKEVTIIKC